MNTNNDYTIGRLSRNLAQQGNFKGAVDFLISEWNRVTNPAILRTDEEHRRCRKLARAIDKRLARMRVREGIHYTEFSNGARYPIRVF